MPINKHIWNKQYASYTGTETESLEDYEEMGYLLKCYLEEKGLLGSRLHVRGDGDIITLFIPNVTKRFIKEVVARGVASIIVQYDRYIEVCEKPKKNGVCIHVIPKRGWRTCTV